MTRDLKARLKSLRESGEVKTGKQFAAALEQPLEDRLFPGEGREEQTSFGRCYMRELRFALDYRHGSADLSGFLNCRGSDLILTTRDRTLEQFNPCSSLFLDIETTGLAGGTGTWAFLIGLGWLDGNQFRLRQYFLRRPAEERAILSHFSDLAARFPGLITFNGKMFDLPMIQTRQMLSGFSQTIPGLHLDLLQCARNLWKKRLPSRTLKALEEELLGLRRYDDIPGAEIPAVYFDYLRRGKTDRLKQVFHHNVLDILSMVTLLERVAELSCGRLIEHPGESLALGKLCLAAGRVGEGLTHLKSASDSPAGELAVEAALELSFYYKRRGSWIEAADIWLHTIDREPEDPTAYVELAKYYEHRLKDYEQAIQLTEKALLLPACRLEVSLSCQHSPEALQRRLDRLKRRLGQLRR